MKLKRKNFTRQRSRENKKIARGTNPVRQILRRLRGNTCYAAKRRNAVKQTNHTKMTRKQKERRKFFNDTEIGARK
jgi:hypothetical protein